MVDGSTSSAFANAALTALVAIVGGIFTAGLMSIALAKYRTPASVSLCSLILRTPNRMYTCAIIRYDDRPFSFATVIASCSWLFVFSKSPSW